jgi:hypothetical protein
MIGPADAFLPGWFIGSGSHFDLVSVFEVFLVQDLAPYDAGEQDRAIRNHYKPDCGTGRGQLAVLG